MPRLTQKALTHKERVEEIFRCGKDPIHFMKTYMHIQHAVRGRLPFDLYDFQVDCVRDYQKYKFNVILKSRQLGMSTVTSAYCLWQALFRRDQNILIMATKLEVGKNMVSKIRVAFKMLPKWMLELLELADPEAESVKYIKFTNGSKITAIPTSADAGRSEAVSLLVIDEAAHIENLGELWAGLKPTVSTGGRVIVFSTPAGKGNFFHELWVGSDTGQWEEGKTGYHALKEGGNNFHAIKLPWDVHPEHDQAWFDNEAKSMSPRLVAQELLCSFESSGHTYFGQSHIDEMKLHVMPPLAYLGPSGKGEELWLWKLEVIGHEYMIAADVARGDAHDFSTFHIVDMTASDIVGEYMGKIPTDDFGVFMHHIGTRFNNALIVVEKNTYGVATCNKLKELEYSNLYYEPELQEKMQTMIPEERRKQTPGFTMSTRSREAALTKLEEVIRNNRLHVYSTRFVTEMESFIYNGKRGQALKGKHDDLIMALAVGLQVFEPAGGTSRSSNEGYTAASWANAFLAGISRNNKAMHTGTNNYGVNANVTPTAYGQRPALEGGLLRPTEVFMGKKLPVGVKREHVEFDYAIRQEYGWLFS